MTLTPVPKQKLQQIGKKYNLKLILLHGSYARERARKGNDLNKHIIFKTVREAIKQYTQYCGYILKFLEKQKQ